MIQLSNIKELEQNAALNDIINNNGILNILYSDFLNKVLNNKKVFISCDIEKFKKKFKISNNLLDPIQDLFDMNEGFILAGGKIIDWINNNQESINDYDIFCIKGSPSLAAIIQRNYKINRSFAYLTEAVKESSQIQIMHKKYACIEDIIEQFDIRACAICTDGKRVYWIKGALKDIKEKKIIILSPKISLSCMLRVLKYYKKGYDIAIPDLIISCINFLDSVNKKNANYIDKKDKIKYLIDRNTIFERGSEEYEEFLDTILTQDILQEN